MTLYFAYGEPLGKTRLEIRKITWMSGLRAGWRVAAALKCDLLGHILWARGAAC